MVKRTTKRGNLHHLLPPDGPGLKVYGTPTDAPWYGNGCGMCGATSDEGPYSPLVPVRVRYWDPDDGWRSGVLCLGCAHECAARGPREGDYAVARQNGRAEAMDTIAEVLAGDDDGAHVESNDLGGD